MLGIVCALRSEAPRLGPDAVVAVSGIGRANAGRAAEDLCSRYSLRGLISAGFAGALAEELEIGDVVVDTEVRAWRKLAGPFEEAPAGVSRSRVVSGRVATVDAIVGSASERRELAARTGAVAADMESAAVAEVARRRGLPFAAVRAVTDTVAKDLALDWNRCLRPDGSFRASALLAQLLRAPRGVAEVRRLWYASRLGSRNLARFLDELLRAA